MKTVVAMDRSNTRRNFLKPPTARHTLGGVAYVLLAVIVTWALGEYDSREKMRRHTEVMQAEHIRELEAMQSSLLKAVDDLECESVKKEAETQTIRRIIMYLSNRPWCCVKADVEHRVTSVRGQPELIGWSPADLVGRPVSVLVPDIDREAHASAMSERSSDGPSGEVRFLKRIECVRQDGEVAYCDSVVLWNDFAQEFVGFFSPAERSVSQTEKD